jgi:hypothetical protein
MSDILGQQNLLILFTFTAGIVSILEILEFLFTRNLPWIARLLQKAWRWLKRLTQARKKGIRTLIVNCSGHPVHPVQKSAIEKLMRWQETEVIDVPLGNVPEDQHFIPAIEKAIDRLDLTSKEWQEVPMVVIPAGYAPIWSVIQPILHGRLGHFPDVVRLRPVDPLSGVRYEVAEIMPLQQLRHESRGKR